MALTASLTGIQIEFADGLLGQDIENKAKPPVRRHVSLES